jgi:hypothetical protein
VGRAGSRTCGPRGSRSPQCKRHVAGRGRLPAGALCWRHSGGEQGAYGKPCQREPPWYGAHGSILSVIECLFLPWLPSADLRRSLGSQKRRAPARGLPRLVRITQNATTPRQDTTGRVENASGLLQFFDGFLSISLLTTRICAINFTPHGWTLGGPDLVRSAVPCTMIASIRHVRIRSRRGGLKDAVARRKRERECRRPAG